MAGMGIPTIKVRAPEGRGQQVLAVTKENAEKVIAERKRRGFTIRRGQAEQAEDPGTSEACSTWSSWTKRPDREESRRGSRRT